MRRRGKCVVQKCKCNTAKLCTTLRGWHTHKHKIQCSVSVLDFLAGLLSRVPYCIYPAKCETWISKMPFPVTNLSWINICNNILVVEYWILYFLSHLNILSLEILYAAYTVHAVHHYHLIWINLRSFPISQKEIHMKLCQWAQTWTR